MTGWHGQRHDTQPVQNAVGAVNGGCVVEMLRNGLQVDTNSTMANRSLVVSITPERAAPYARPSASSPGHPHRAQAAIHSGPIVDAA
jgi:hypothetical protein